MKLFSPFLHLLALMLTGAACCTPVWSQTIYRCGSVYSQQPCPDAIALDVSDTRTPAQKAQTDVATARAAKMAAQMEKERLAREKIQAAKSSNKSSRSVKTAKTGSLTSAPKAAVRKKKEPEYFTAAVSEEKKDRKVDKKAVDKAQVAEADKTDQALKP
jgi:hypothetical protein